MHKSTYSPSFFAEALWPKATLGRDIALILVGSWLVALFAQIQIPLWPVPITGQTFGVLLIGALLGSRRGTLSLLAYLAQGAAGLPFFAGSAAGIAVLAGPTGGYLVGFVAAAYVVGWLSERGWDRRFATAVAAMLVGNLVIYTFGLSWLVHFVGRETLLQAGLLPFLPGDLAKILLAALVLPSGWALLQSDD